MKIRYLTLLTTLVFFGFSVSAFAGKVCQDGDTRPKCNGGGGGDDHGDPPAKYCAQLISGGFDFGLETVTRNNRGNAYTSPHGLIMDRPTVLAPPYDQQPPYDPPYSQAAWDAVFETCEILTSLGSIELLAVSDKWEIGNGGGKSAGEGGTPVAVSFKNAHSALYPGIEVDLHLRGKLPDGGFPLGPNDIPDNVVIDLYDFWFYVHASGTDSCKIITTFEEQGEGEVVVPHSVLKMTWGPC